MYLYFQLIFFSLGTVVIFGYANHLLIVVFKKLIGGNNYVKLHRVTAYLGTPIHEVSHYIMCILFGHRVIDMKLYEFDQEKQQLGYVSHSWNNRNLYHRLGNLFIGIAPLVIMPITVYLLMKFLNPNMYTNTNLLFQSIQHLSYLTILKSIMKITYDFLWLDDIAKVISFIIIISLFFHMELSEEDMKGSLSGFVFFFILIGILTFVLSIFNPYSLTFIIQLLKNYTVLMFVLLILNIMIHISIYLIYLIIHLLAKTLHH